MAQITLKKLSELSGLSIRTVSRVLKNQANVVPEKRELVLKLAEQYQSMIWNGVCSPPDIIPSSAAPTISAPISAR